MFGYSIFLTILWQWQIAFAADQSCGQELAFSFHKLALPEQYGLLEKHIIRHLRKTDSTIEEIKLSAINATNFRNVGTQTDRISVKRSTSKTFSSCIDFSYTVQSETNCHQLAPYSVDQGSDRKDFQHLLDHVTEKVNSEVDNVIYIGMDYEGQRKYDEVGDHIIRSFMTYKGDSDEIVHTCYEINLKVHDVDECNLPVSHPLRHVCDPSAQCVNTNGSYYCQCTAFTATVKSFPKCHLTKNSLECCDASCGEYGVDVKCHSDCRKNFFCRTDPCPGNCDKSATCVSTEIGQYNCNCPEGTVGTGLACGPFETPQTPWYTPGNKAINNTGTCGCQKPRIDHCYQYDCGDLSVCVNGQNGPECHCKKGYHYVEGHGCVDLTPPKLVLRGANPYRLNRCSIYQEFSVDIIDENIEDYVRKVTISYSPEPLGACSPRVGTYYVTYSIEADWIETSRVINVTRVVIIEDINQCLITSVNDKRCQHCIPRCIDGAHCKPLNGSYECVCPTCTSGDGFVELDRSTLKKYKPTGYRDGKGCTDSCPPEIHIQGDNPKLITLIQGTNLLGNQTCTFDLASELKAEVRRTKGEYVCGIPGSICATAVDKTPDGSKDLSKSIVVGDVVCDAPVTEASGDHVTRCKLAYDVTDSIGNKAQTKYRQIEIRVIPSKVALDCLSRQPNLLTPFPSNAPPTCGSDQVLQYIEKYPTTLKDVKAETLDKVNLQRRWSRTELVAAIREGRTGLTAADFKSLGYVPESSIVNPAAPPQQPPVVLEPISSTSAEDTLSSARITSKLIQWTILLAAGFLLLWIFFRVFSPSEDDESQPPFEPDSGRRVVDSPSVNEPDSPMNTTSSSASTSTPIRPNTRLQSRTSTGPN